MLRNWLVILNESRIRISRHYLVITGRPGGSGGRVGATQGVPHQPGATLISHPQVLTMTPVDGAHSPRRRVGARERYGRSSLAGSTAPVPPRRHLGGPAVGHLAPTPHRRCGAAGGARVGRCR